ncbi:MAG TPA: PAS domain-containing sensor histidine kinase [Polyangia bacterium]|nr:PAS domain-containing sensor histidine kinase [Polyangia bacterium]
MGGDSFDSATYEELLASFADALCVFDRELRFAFVTPSAAAPLGLAASEVIGRTWRELGLPAQVMEPVEARVRSVFAGGEPVRAETPFVGPDGPRHYEYIITPVRAPDGAVKLVSVISRDVTERKRAEHALSSARGFEQKILAIVGHDIRNPLAAIDMAAEMLLRRAEPSSLAERHAERIKRSVGRIHHIVADLLDFTRARHGGIPIAPEKTSLEVICKHVVDELEVSVADHTIELSSDGEAVGFWDPHRIGQAVSNLVGNAVKHSPAGTPVHVTIADGAPAVTLEVRNHGAIPAELLPVIFDPFSRGGEAERAGDGLGLGLFIAQSIVNAHRGRIEVTSSPAEGTRVRVTLPRQC